MSIASRSLLDQSTSDQPPSVSTTLSLLRLQGHYDGLVTASFTGYDPQVTGGLTLAMGETAYLVAKHEAAAAPLQHVLAATPIHKPAVLADLNFTTPGHGADQGLAADIAIASTATGFGNVLDPLTAALQGTALGKELAPLGVLANDLLPGVGANGGVPTGGSLHALPWFSAEAGVGVSQTVTVLGQATTTSAGGSLALTEATGPAAVTAATDSATLLSDGATLLSDVQSGNLLGAASEGVAALGAATALTGALAPLITAAAQQQNPTLAPVHNPVLSLDLATSDSQVYSLGVGTPAGTGESLQVTITADTYGAYALGKVLANIAPQLVADLTGGTTQTAENIFAQLAQGVSALTQDAAAGFAGTGGAGAIPSSVVGPDISITARLVTTEQQNAILGSVSNAQTFALGFDTNAQGFYDLATAAQPALTDLLVGLLETPGGQEALQIGGDILTQIDAKFGGASAMVLPSFTHA